MSDRTGESLLFRLPTHERRLDNGLTVLVREDHSAPVVAVVTRVKAGYFNEPDRLVGISHVLEHMFFKGTEERGVGEIARETKAAGGYLNAGTIYDYTSYYTVLPSASLEMGLDIQSDALRNSEIDEEELRKELRVIIQEAKRKLDNPSAVAVESLYEEMFDIHRIRRWRIGTEAGLERLTREDVWNYYASLYRPSNIILSIAGDVEPERVFGLVERYYGDMPAGEVVRETSPEEPERRGLRFREMSGDITQSYAEWGWRTPGTLHPDTPALDLLAIVLGQGRASRLYRNVRDEGLVTAIGAYNYTPTEIGVFGVSSDLLPEDTRAAGKAVWHTIDSVRRQGVAAAELDRAKNILEARMVRRSETAEGQANMLAEWQALGDWRRAADYMDRLFAVTREDVRRVAEEYLDLDLATMLVYRPESADPLGWDAEDLEELLAGGRPASPEGAPAARVEGAGPGARASVGPATVEDEVHLYELDGGVRVAVQPRRTAPLVSMRIAGPGGLVDESPEQAGRTGLMTRTSVKGTETRSASELAEETEALGGAISATTSSDLFHWTLTVPSRHFAHGFELLADAALRPTFPERELERERRIALTDLEQVRDDMYRYPLRLFLQGAFGDHPYGYSIATKEASVRALGREDLVRWHRGHVLQTRPWVLIVGDVDPDEAAAAAAAQLRGVGGDGPAGDAPRPDWPTGPVEEAARREKKQTALVLGFPGPDRNHDDSYTLDVLSNAVSGLGGRIFAELRDRRHLAYTVSAYPISRRLAGAFVAYIATSPEKEDEARSALLEQIEQIAEDGITAEELERARRYTIGSWQIRSQTNGAHLADLTGALLLGDGLAELRAFEEKIRSVTPEKIRQAARTYLRPERVVEGIVRGTGGGR